jgi:DNA-binding protein HU-beta
MATQMSKSQLIEKIATNTELSKREIKNVMDTLTDVGHKELKKNGIFLVPGFAKFVVVKKPATKARKGTNPFTGEEMMFKATPARRNVMKRLSDLGNLSLAVRRSWKALDQARIAVDPAIDAKARQILPTLSPVEILDLSRIYLAAAAGLDRSKRLDLIHAAAALYGTAVLTTSEMRLLRHLKLLRYQV